MRPTYRARRSAEPPPLDRAGFTLIETVIALALCALLAGAVASSLGTALRAERQAVEQREARRAGDELQQALLHPGAFEFRSEPLRRNWTLTSAPQVTGAGSNATDWAVWEFSRPGVTGRRGYLAVRQL